jgi:hypothetical protein
MNFKNASDHLTNAVSHIDIAIAAGVSVQSIRQARLDSHNPNYRSPPHSWQKILARLARERSKALNQLAIELERA